MEDVAQIHLEEAASVPRVRPGEEVATPLVCQEVEVAGLDQEGDVAQAGKEDPRLGRAGDAVKTRTGGGIELEVTRALAEVIDVLAFGVTGVEDAEGA